MGLLSVLGRSYDTTLLPAIGNLYYQGAAYNFQDPAVYDAIRAIWDSAYTCIGELNNMLAQMEEKKQLFTGNDYYNLKAEALAFGPSCISICSAVWSGRTGTKPGCSGDPLYDKTDPLCPARPCYRRGAGFLFGAICPPQSALFKDSTVVPPAI